jgi:hypothetical protein
MKLKKTLRGWDSGHPGKIKKIFEVLISHIKKLKKQSM